jgi:purine-binding chemotaxis protein CheW
VGVQDEYFAMPLDLIQEFSDVNQITPIPCCPPHIVGNMNLRGEILTLVDMRPFLNLSMTTATRPEKAVIVKVEQIVAGLIVDAVFDVVYVSPEAMTGVPSAIHAIDNEYVRSVTAYNSAMMSILNVTKLLTQGDLEVNQAA